FLKESAPDLPLVVDPVMVASSGAVLLREDAIATLRRDLLPRAAVITPNLDELGVLVGRRPHSLAEMRAAGRQLADETGAAVLAKGGHLEGDALIDLLILPDGREEAFRATLVYADPMGVPNSSVHRINDLTLKVTDPQGIVYWGNNGLSEGNWSVAGGSPNDRDTVENVFVQNPSPGSWTIEVIADEINEDSHPETSALDADYALVVSPGIPVPPMELTTSSPFTAGQDAFATVTGATPNGRVYLAYSIYGFGTTPVPQLGVDLNLDLARLAAAEDADSAGVADFTFAIPPNVGPRMLWLQACELDNTTNVVIAEVQ
ncbi:MAG: bifunctional hydroxymethylpyrimidine kinase/phosphomethylpyrimidine kinase, partial [Planctomycetota bacterium]